MEIGETIGGISAVEREYREMHENTVVYHVKHLAGRVLTIIESSLPEGKQSSAVKALIKREFRDELNSVYLYFHQQKEGGVSFAGLTAYSNPKDVVDLTDPQQSL